MTSAKEDRSRFGTVGVMPDGRSFVRFERRLPQTVEQVWAAISEPAQRAHWFPGLDFEPRKGGVFRMNFDGDCDGPAHVEGTVLVWEPPYVLQLGTMRWALSRTTDGGCRLVFTDILVFDGRRDEQDITHAVLGGWHRYVDRLEDAAAGRPVDLAQPEPDYAARR